MNPTLVVLAAGIGSRYGGLKQIDPVGPHGEVVIDYSIYDAIQAGFDRVVFIIRKDIERAFRDHISGRFEHRIDVDFVFQELDNVPPGCTVPPGRQKPWGTGHAVLTAVDALNGPFCVLNADDFYGRDAFRAMAKFLSRSAIDTIPAQYAMVGFHLANTLSEHGHVSRGICDVDEHGFLRRVVERTHIEKTTDGACFIDENGERQQLLGTESVSMNIWGFTPSIFAHLNRAFSQFVTANPDNLKAELYIPTVVDELIRNNDAQVAVLDTDAQWFGVTYPDDKAMVVDNIRQLITAGQYPDNLWNDAG